MALRINTNIAALNAHRQVTLTDSKLSTSIERLSSGLKINKAKDDVAGLAIANKFRNELRSLRKAQENAAQAVSMLQVAEGGASRIEEIIERLKELATQAASDNTDSDGRTRLNAEAAELLEEIDRIANDTKYSNTQLINDSKTFTFQIGSYNTSDQDVITVGISDGLLTSDLGINNINLSTLASASAALDDIDDALASVNVILGEIGAGQSRLDFATENLGVSVENIAASESTIRDVDMAYEMVNFTRHQIMLQAGTAMLAQANMAPQQVLALFA